MTVLNCATGTLSPYVPSAERPWNLDRVRHLYRRVGFGATPDELDVALELSPADLVNQLLDNAFNAPLVEEPEWAYWDYDTFVANGIDETFPVYVEWMKGFMQRGMENGPRERLTIFWHNHFVTKYETYSCPSLMFQYHRILEGGGFGDFKQLVYDIGITPAMLFFLNGFENTQFSPNENYARELFELFTLGEDNGYTQQDIVEASRALTGYNGWTTYCGPVEFAQWGLDTGEKTIFGRTGNFGYGELIDVLFEERGTLIAEFICRKLYMYYVNLEVDEGIVAAMAQTFLANNFQVGIVLRELFLSEHFFDEANMAVLVKSPLDMLMSMHREGGFGDFENRLEWMFWAAAQLGMQLMEPPDVAGWTGDRSWIDSSRLTNRWQTIDGFSWSYQNEDPDVLVRLARRLTNDSNDTEVIAQAMVDHFVMRGLVGDNAYETARDVLRWDIPITYYETGAWNLDWESAPYQLLLLVQHIARHPEFQLY
ncbi:MAG: DUF1800 domain-containing protein [Bacteroidota bacterium]